MPYTQLTHCVPPSEAGQGGSNMYSATEDAGAAALWGAISAAIVGGIFGILTGDIFIGVGVGVAIGACVAIRKWQDLYNNHRLICVNPDQCVAGTVTKVEPPPSGASSVFHVDNDYVFNLLPLPHEFNKDKAEEFQIEETRDQIILDKFMGETFVGDPDSITALDLHSSEENKVIHCEIEGNAPDVLADAICVAAVIAGAAVAASQLVITTVCFVGGGILGAIICNIILALVLLLIAAVILAIAAAIAIGLLAHDGTPGDVADNKDSATINEGDFFLVKGNHVYEGGHLPSVWPEIHPVKEIYKLNDVQADIKLLMEIYKNGDLTAIDKLRLLVSSWCGAISKSKDPAVILAQSEPSNQWIDHPLLDGCTEPPVID